MSHLWQAAAGQRLPLQTARYRPGDRMPQGSAISTLSVPVRRTGLEPDFGSPLGASDARVAPSAGEPGRADFVSQGCGSASERSSHRWAELPIPPPEAGSTPLGSASTNRYSGKLPRIENLINRPSG